MSSVQDGPSSSLFRPVPFTGNVSLSELGRAGVSDEMAVALEHAPRGACVGWGIPFEIEDVVLISRDVVSVELSPTTAQWLIFMHTSDLRPVTPGPDGFISPMRGLGHLAERAGLSAACSAAGVGLDVLLLMRDAFPETEGPNDL